MKISLGMIVRDEGATLDRCLQSIAAYVDEIVIGLAGESTDNTPAIAKKWAHKVLDIPWTDHFSEARNAVLEEQLKGNPDYLMWLDGDDIVIGGEHIREFVEQYQHINAFHMGYDYGRDESDTTICYLIRERIVRADGGWRWRGRIHEVMWTETPGEMVFMPDTVVQHVSVKKPRSARNTELLYRELADSEPNPEPRLLVYLGNEEAGRGNFLAGISLWQRFIKLSQWNEEVYQAQHKIADVYRAMGRLDDARNADFRAIQITPHWPDAYFGLAETAYRAGNFNECIEWTKAGATKEVPRTSLVVNPLDYFYYPRITVATAYMHTGDVEAAHENFKLAHEYRPTPDTAQMLYNLQEGQRIHAIKTAFLGLVEQLCRHDEWLKAREIFRFVPKSIEQNKEVVELMQLVYANTAHVEDPAIMEDHYINNPSWVPMDEATVFSEDWKKYPRLAYASSVARKLEANTIVDLGCSDGFMSLPLAQEGYKVDGVDLDPRCISVAQERAQAHGLSGSTTFTQGNISIVEEWAKCPNFFKYDLALLFETIEHLVDPKVLLDQVDVVAKHVAITTPHLAWEDGNVNWSRQELKGHLRIFDLVDIEMLLSPRGTIHNLYREPWGGSGWIFADYAVGEKPSGHIQIVCPGGLEAWGPRKLQREGLGGSETAVIRLGEELAAKDKLVSVYNQIDEPGYYNRVRYRPISQYHPGVKSELTIAWRAPELADRRPNCDIFVLWMHDVEAGDRLTPERAAEFDFIVVQTGWHLQYMLKRYPFLDVTKMVIIGNGVTFENFRLAPTRNPKRVIYASSPDRGLDIILEHIWPRVIESVPDAELHYYYGWNNIDAASAAVPGLFEFKQKVAGLTLATKNVVNHGRLPQNELAQELMRSSIWLYPTYFHETYCITAIEAQLAGLVPVTNNLAALNETVRAEFIPGEVTDPAVQELYAKRVIGLIKNPPDEDQRAKIVGNAPAVSWSERADQWLQTFVGEHRADHRA